MISGFIQRKWIKIKWIEDVHIYATFKCGLGEQKLLLWKAIIKTATSKDTFVVRHACYNFHRLSANDLHNSNLYNSKKVNIFI